MRTKRKPQSFYDKVLQVTHCYLFHTVFIGREILGNSLVVQCLGLGVLPARDPD